MEIKNAAHRKIIEQLYWYQAKDFSAEVTKGTQKRTELTSNLSFAEMFRVLDHWSSLLHCTSHPYNGREAATFVANVETRGRHRKYVAYLSAEENGCTIHIRNDF